jgi:glycosyltransferase involved in cell wall biosynthesis
MTPKIAILIPCFQEEVAIGKVVRDFRAVFPEAVVYVYDNNSTDGTVDAAKDAGALVRREPQQGKGHVVRRMFRDIDADFYLLVDGDDTYDALVAPDMLGFARDGGYDLVNCIRDDVEHSAYRRGHRWGNDLLTGAVRRIFGDRVKDMLSGYKLLSRRFVKSFPALSQGFDIETELTVHALELSMPIAHARGAYRGRPEGSESKLRTWRDGWRILSMIVRLVRHERPMMFFGALAGALFAAAIAIAAPIFVTFAETGLVPRLPTAVLATGIVLLTGLSLVTGLVLDTVSRGRREVRFLAYLQHPPFPMTDESGAETGHETGDSAERFRAAVLKALPPALRMGNARRA